jgi:hypothetical protein
MRWLSLSPETWLGLALLIAIGAAITCLAYSQKLDARMNFFFRLFENLPSDEVLGTRTHEANPVRQRQET